MAKENSIEVAFTPTPLFKAYDAIEDALMAAEILGHAFDKAGGDHVPEWVFIYQRELRSIRAAVDSLHPACVGVNWGVGVVDPDDDKGAPSKGKGRGTGAGMPDQSIAS